MVAAALLRLRRPIPRPGGSLLSAAEESDPPRQAARCQDGSVRVEIDVGHNVCKALQTVQDGSLPEVKNISCLVLGPSGHEPQARADGEADRVAPVLVACGQKQQ